MKEFISQTGGRHIYNDDIKNLQDLALAFSHIFDGCGDFVVSGCEKTSSGISSGIVYLGGKIREFAGASGTFPLYIVEKNTTENVAYKDFGDKVGRNVYEATYSIQKPSSGNYITVDNLGKAPRITDAFFGKYALMMDEPNTKHVKHDVVFDKKVSSQSLLSEQATLQKGGSSRVVEYDEGGNLVISVNVGGKKYKISYSANGIKFYLGGLVLYDITADAIFVKGCIESSLQFKVGEVVLSSPHLYNRGGNSDTAAININMLGYNNGSEYFRDTYIGDGKGHAIICVNGKNQEAGVKGVLKVDSPYAYPVIIKSAALKDESFQSGIKWTDADNITTAEIGFLNIANKDFFIKNNAGGNIRLNTNTFIEGKLYVDGIDILKSLKDQTVINDAVSKIDEKLKGYIKKIDPIDIFVEHAGGGIAGKRAVCDAIGAANYDMVQDSFKQIFNTQLEFCGDTGWIDCNGQGVAAKARQIGHVVCITGYAFGPGSGAGKCPFNLPAQISKPDYPVIQLCGFTNEHVSIAGRQQIGTQPNETYAIAGSYFSITYIY